MAVSGTTPVVQGLPRKLDAAARLRRRIVAQARRRGYGSLSQAQIGKLTPGQRSMLGIGVNNVVQPVPGDTRGGTDFSTVPQTPGEVRLINGEARIVPVGTTAGAPTNTTKGTPASPAPPTQPQGPPPDAAYDLGVTGAEGIYRASMGAVEAQRIAAGEDYGFDPTTGRALSNVDVTNPFSRAALMNRSFRAQNRMTTGGFGVGNRLTSGAYAAALQSNQFNQLGQRRSLERDFASQLLDFRTAEQQAGGTFATTKGQLMGELLQRRMQQDAPNTEEIAAGARQKLADDRRKVAADRKEKDQRKAAARRKRIAEARRRAAAKKKNSKGGKKK